MKLLKINASHVDQYKKTKKLLEPASDFFKSFFSRYQKNVFNFISSFSFLTHSKLLKSM